jgi:hypothetical protein
MAQSLPTFTFVYIPLAHWVRGATFSLAWVCSISPAASWCIYRPAPAASDFVAPWHGIVIGIAGGLVRAPARIP